MLHNLVTVREASWAILDEFIKIKQQFKDVVLREDLDIDSERSFTYIYI
jgi:hypothetical protein